MLAQLNISNFAIISHLEIQFSPGLNVLSGETGAGKSIIINAVNLILGGRASSELIRSGSSEAVVEALFRLPEDSAVGRVLSGFGIPFDGELLIKRHISREGRNRIVINGSMATGQMLSKVGSMLISISGQHEHQLLLRPDNHLYLLDGFGSLAGERSKLNEAFARYQSLTEKKASLEREIRTGMEKQELVRFQKEEIDKAALKEGEDELLAEEKKRLQHAEQLMQIVTEAYQAFYEREHALISELSIYARQIKKAEEYDRRLSDISKALDSAKLELEEASLGLRELQGSIVVDPQRLEQVDERLQLINRLKRKYGSSINEILKFRVQLSEIMDNLDHKKEELARIEQEIHAMEERLSSQARELSRNRKQVAKDLEKNVKKELELLNMAGTRFEVRFEPDLGSKEENATEVMKIMRADGYDRVEFMLSPNVGEELKPLARIASGGELSRIILALKSILARKASVETIIFDEVDSGIGGETAEVVGEKLRSLAGYHQILCITHLPQIASKGTTHFLVQKEVKDKRTQTVISELAPEERVKEIARLLGGKKITRKGIEHAREILAH